MVLGKDRQRKKLDTLLAQSFGLLGGGLPVDAPRRCFLVVDLACLVGKTRPNVFRLGLNLGSQLAHGGHELPVRGEAMLRRVGAWLSPVEGLLSTVFLRPVEPDGPAHPMAAFIALKRAE